MKSFHFQYKLFNENLELVEQLTDLGIVFEITFKFKAHLYVVTSEVFKMLGFIKRSTNKFKNISSII